MSCLASQTAFHVFGENLWHRFSGCASNKSVNCASYILILRDRKVYVTWTVRERKKLPVVHESALPALHNVLYRTLGGNMTFCRMPLNLKTPSGICVLRPLQRLFVPSC